MTAEEYDELKKIATAMNTLVQEVAKIRKLIEKAHPEAAKAVAAEQKQRG